MSERRKFTRDNVIIEAKMSYSDTQNIPAYILSTSSSSVYVQAEGTQLPKVSELVDITFLVDIDGEDEHTFSSKVVRIDYYGEVSRIVLKLENVDESYMTLMENIKEDTIKESNVA